ncbi:TPA: hypothetical protein N0F65_007537 [Lagenidium giganteum]|uniref:Retrovirus-related Pol polyprotein from transposon TNT 1-94-like beta-barrel domain-containing protein n=1 Tax=Lagenidium giganteum TaxID=4803 RepID=A0AAV2ZSL5_9STRA|nr:TPA: hypothetical protein N0F65_007537 [Lagenidium giganteum]
MKALAVLVKMLSPTYQMIVRNARSAKEAWDILQTFFVTKNLHNRVQLRKQLHGSVMAVGEDQDDEHVFAVCDSEASGMAWLPDSGASVHMTFDLEDFIEYRTLVDILEVTVANGQRLRAAGAGLVRLGPEDGKPVTLTEVLHVPKLNRKLMSIPALSSKGASCVFEATKCIVYSGKEQVLAAEK